MTEIYVVRIEDGIADGNFNDMLKLVPKDRRQRIMRFRRREDALRALAAEMLIRSVIIGECVLENGEPVFETNAHGKPFLKNKPGFHFNLSHSGCWVACAVDDQPVGVDVERIHEIDFDIAKRFFSPEEYGDLMDKAEPDRLAYFFDLWTLKESYLKAAGTGLSVSLKSFTIRKDGGNISIKNNREMSRCFFKQYEIDPGYKLSVCALHWDFAGQVVVRELAQMEQVLLKYN